RTGRASRGEAGRPGHRGHRGGPALGAAGAGGAGRVGQAAPAGGHRRGRRQARRLRLRAGRGAARPPVRRAAAGSCGAAAVPRARQPWRSARRPGADRAGRGAPGDRVGVVAVGGRCRGGRRAALAPRRGGFQLLLSHLCSQLWHGEDVRVLVVEDEEPLAQAVARGLRREGMAVDVALTGDEGHEKAMITRYDVVVLDRDLPGMHGDQLCEEIINSGELTRVLMLTASGTVEDRVDGLSRGADDYLAKPFAFPELVARVRALARRATPP